MVVHKCGEGCKCRVDLNAAAAGLAEASRLLSASILSDSDDVVETYLAFVRATHAKVLAAFSSYRNHIAQA